MNWVVTGGCGFIGSNFIRYILQKYEDIKITNIDKLTYAGNLENLRSLESNPKYKFIKGDITNYSLLSSIFTNNIDLVINFAAETHVDRSIKGGDEFINTNVLGTHILLKFCNQYDIKFVQISTDEVYGSRKEGHFTENDILNPSSLYSSSKAAADLLVKSYFITYGLDIKITRSSNNFGPYQYPEKLIPLFITNLIRNKKVPVYGTGQNVREWVFVEDNCAAIDTVIQKGKKGEIYNIGSGIEKTNLEITKLILSKFDYGDEMIEFVPDRLGHDFRYALDTSKIRGLGWKPKYNFEEAFDLTISWYKKNRSWWEPLLTD
ncbi:MAG: dTDP-glucose 4,6-dehydratase [Candidatus Heimdallarchaeaceae archaeon]